MSRLSLVRTSLLLFALLACGGEPGTGQATPGAATAVGAPFSPKDFRDLRWLAGSWRGEASGGKPFYEGYQFTNDSTLVMTYFADSTLTRATGTGTVEYRGGRVLHRSGQSLWVVTRSDSSGLHFAPVERARNSFIWKRESPTAWTASLSSPGGAPVVYRMTRLPR